jgi:hypothetical protein
MRVPRFCCFLDSPVLVGLVLMSLVLASAARAAESPTLTTAQYREQLQNYETRVAELASSPQNAPGFRDSLPQTLTVETSHGEMTVDLGFLRETLNHFLTSPPPARPAIVSALGGRLHAMSAEGGLYDQPSRADDAARKRLEQILSSREFDHVRGPSALELFKQRLQAWILKQLRKINPKVPDLQDAGQIFVWCMIGLACAVAVVWLYRVSREGLSERKREIIPFHPSARNWLEWLSDARARAAAGQWRDAIHFGFWAAVSRLESEGVWPPDKTRTPREYLNAIPGDNFSKEPFGAITRKFESSWYGSRPTTEADFVQFTDHLERLGCR